MSQCLRQPKWVIEKCKLGRNCWHVYGPDEPVLDDECFMDIEREFRTGVEAIAFVAEQLTSTGPDWTPSRDSYQYESSEAARGEKSL
jgi:hypothetical protein